MHRDFGLGRLIAYKYYGSPVSFDPNSMRVYMHRLVNDGGPPSQLTYNERMWAAVATGYKKS